MAQAQVAAGRRDLAGVLQALADQHAAQIGRAPESLGPCTPEALAQWLHHHHGADESLGRARPPAPQGAWGWHARQTTCTRDPALDWHIEEIAPSHWLTAETWTALLPLVRRWVARPLNVTPYRPRFRASLPRFDSELELPNLSVGAPASMQPTLPGLELSDATGNWLVELYRQALGDFAPRSRAAPLELRLFVALLINLPVKQRDGNWHRMIVSTDDIAHWVFDGRPRKGYAQAIIDATWRLMHSRAAYLTRNGWTVPILRIHTLHAHPRGADVAVEIRVPNIATPGARIEWPRVVRYGCESLRRYCAYLAICEHLARSARNGHPITSQIAAPVLGADGRPIRRRGRGVVRNENETQPNPAARFNRALSSQDLARMCALDPDRKQYRHRAVMTFEELAADGALELVRAGRHWRVFGAPVC